MPTTNVVNKVYTVYCLHVLCSYYIVECQNFLQNKIVDLLAHLIQVQLDEASNTIGKLSRMVN